MSRFVFDTNALVSALLFEHSVPRQALDQALNIGTLLVSDSLIAELDRVLARDRFDQYVTSEERLEFTNALMLESELIAITEPIQACEDPDDDRILELAINGSAVFIITGDSDLLTMNPFRGVDIVTPVGFLRRINESVETT